MISLKQLQFKNFFSYSNQLTTINFEDGMFLIMGKNGSGKSVILDAIFYCWYGKSLRIDIKNSEIINRINKKNMYVKTVFNVDNIEYSISRGLKPNIFQIWKNGEKLEEYNKNDMQKYVEEYILKFDEKIFKQIVILGSDLHTPFLKLSLPERRFLIEKLFDFDTLTKIKNIAKEEYKEKEKLLFELKNKNQINITKINSLKEEKNRIENENDRIISSKRLNIKKIENEIKKIEDEIKILKIKINENINDEEKEKYEKRVYDIAIKINDVNYKKTKKIQKLNEKLNEEYINLNNNKKDIDNDVKIIFEKLKEKNKIIDEEIYKVTENEELRNEQEILKTNNTGLDKIDTYNKDFFEQINKKLLEINLNNNKLLERLKFYKKNDSCEICGTVFTGEKKKNIISGIKIKLDELKNKEGIYLDKLKELNKRKDEIKRKLKELIKTAEKNISRIEINIYKENEKKKELLIKEVGELEKEYDKYTLKFMNIEKEIEVFKKNKRNKEKEIEIDYEIEVEKLMEEKDKIIKEKTKFEEELKEQVKIKNIIGLHLQKKEMLNVNLKEQKNIKLISIDEVNKKLLECRKEYKRFEDEIRKKERFLEYIEKIIDMFSDKGIRSVLIQKYLPVLNNKMFEFLNEFNCDFNIEFDKSFDTKIIKNKNENENISYGTYSSGQRQRMNLAILFTFMAFMKLKQGINCNLLIFDEILDSSLDEDGIKIFFKLLERFSIKEKYCIFVISHRESNMNYFQNIYKVEMKKKFSNIQKIMI